MNEVTGTTTLLATFGNPNIGSPAPAAYNAVLREMGLDYIYVAFEPNDAKELIDSIRSLGIGGGTIARPFKHDIMPFLDEIDDDARTIGAVNIVVNNDGKLSGYNGDGTSVLGALCAHTDLEKKRVALLGAGGASRSIAFHLNKHNALTTIFNRTRDKGQSIADDFDQTFGGGLDDVDASFDVIINATSIGFGKEEGNMPISESALANQPLVFDIIAKPPKTPLIHVAEKLGCQTLRGVNLTMFLSINALTLLTGQQVPVEIVEKVFA